MAKNFIHTANPFGLADPPRGFLRSLAAYDPDVVLFPSTEEPVYRMGRRASRTRVGFEADVLEKHQDARIFRAHGLLAWKSIWPNANWARVLLELPEYDTRRFADPGQQLDDIEAAEEQALDRQIADEADQRAADIYRTYQLIEGKRVGAGRRPEGAGYRKLPTQKRGSRRSSPYRPLGGQAMWLPSRGSIVVPADAAKPSDGKIVVASS